MAKNYIQEGKTIAITATAAIGSGELVQIGDMFAVAITDIADGGVGDGFAEGVFSVPKLSTDNMTAGKSVYFKGGKVQLDATGNLPKVGTVWQAAGASTEQVAVKLNV